MTHSTLFDLAGELPPGFHYARGFITEAEERALLEEIAALEFSRVEMHGAVARRRTAHFGWTYGYYARRTAPGPALPEFLLGVRARAAAWAEIDSDAFAEALVTEYPAGAPIGWHRDAPMFGDVIAGVSLGAGCVMKFRPYASPAAKVAGPRRTTHRVELAPRSGYLISGDARRSFEHSIPPVEALRYSITFRTLREVRAP